MLTGLKAPSLAWQCVFYRPKLVGKGEPYRIEVLSSWNAKVKYVNRQSSKSTWGKWGQSCYVYSQSYGH